MLNKVRFGVIVGAILSALSFFLVDVDFPAGLQEAIVLIAVFVGQFFVKETPETVGKLTLR